MGGRDGALDRPLCTGSEATHRDPRSGDMPIVGSEEGVRAISLAPSKLGNERGIVLDEP